MAEFLPGVLAVVLEETYVLEAGVALEVENALGGEAEKVRDFLIAGVPQMAVVAGIFDQDFMRADRVHAVINAIAAAAGLAFDVVERLRMHHGARRPRCTGSVWSSGNHLQRLGVGTKRAGGLDARSRFAWVIARDDPGTRDGILSEFHREGEH